MADKKIDEVTHDDAIGGSEKFPIDDNGTAKYATTGDVKNYVLAQIAAIAAAQGVNLDADGVYLLKDGAIKSINAQTLAGAVLDYGLSLTGIASVNGNETIGIKDGGSVKKTMTVTQLANYLAANVTIPWATLPEVTLQSDLASGDFLVFRDVSAGTSGQDKKFTFTTFSAYVHAAFKAYVTDLTGIQSGDSVVGTDIIYLIHGNEARQATVAQLLASVGITNAVSGPNATTENKLPQWDSSTRTLKDGLAVVTSIGSSPSDTAVPTENAVATALQNISTANLVNTTSDQTVGGTKTFSLPPIVPAPTQSGHAATKSYVDGKTEGQIVLLTGDQTVGGVKTFSLSPVVPSPQGDYNPATKKYVDDNYASLAGTQTISGVKTFSEAPLVTESVVTGDNSTKTATTAWVVSKLAVWWTAICGAAQSISGVWTFSSSPVVPTPTDDMQACTKKYVDDNAVKLTGDQTVYGTKTFSASPVVPTVADVTDNTTKAASTAFVHGVVDTLDLRLAFVNKTFDAGGVLTLDDRSINAFTLPVIESGSDTTYTVNIPTDDSDTHSRFFGIVLAVGSAASGSLELKLQTGPTYYAEAADTFTIAAGSYNLILFREMKSTNEFLVSRRTLSATGTAFTGTIA